jgi:hypothetical protein
LVDTSIWDWLEEFTASDIAALVRGEGPTTIVLQQGDPILTRIQQAFNEAFHHHLVHFHSSLDLDDRESPPQSALECTAMTTTGFAYEDWMNSNQNLLDLSNQKFLRKEVARWVKFIGFPSKYNFDPGIASSASIEANRGYVVQGKLSTVQKAEIKRRFDLGETKTSLAKEFEVHRNTIDKALGLPKKTEPKSHSSSGMASITRHVIRK